MMVDLTVLSAWAVGFFLGAAGLLVAQRIARMARDEEVDAPLVVPFEACGFDPSFDVPTSFAIENEPVDDDELPTRRVEVPNVTRRVRGLR